MATKQLSNVAAFIAMIVLGLETATAADQGWELKGRQKTYRFVLINPAQVENEETYKNDRCSKNAKKTPDNPRTG